jgi:hypothetical protein
MAGCFVCSTEPAPTNSSCGFMDRVGFSMHAWRRHGFAPDSDSAGNGGGFVWLQPLHVPPLPTGELWAVSLACLAVGVSGIALLLPRPSRPCVGDFPCCRGGGVVFGRLVATATRAYRRLRRLARWALRMPRLHAVATTGPLPPRRRKRRHKSKSSKARGAAGVVAAEPAAEAAAKAAGEGPDGVGGHAAGVSKYDANGMFITPPRGKGGQKAASKWLGGGEATSPKALGGTLCPRRYCPATAATSTSTARQPVVTAPLPPCSGAAADALGGAGCAVANEPAEETSEEAAYRLKLRKKHDTIVARLRREAEAEQQAGGGQRPPLQAPRRQLGRPVSPQPNVGARRRPVSPTRHHLAPLVLGASTGEAGVAGGTGRGRQRVDLGPARPPGAHGARPAPLAGALALGVLPAAEPLPPIRMGS